MCSLMKRRLCAGTSATGPGRTGARPAVNGRRSATYEGHGVADGPRGWRRHGRPQPQHAGDARRVDIHREHVVPGVRHGIPDGGGPMAAADVENHRRTAAEGHLGDQRSSGAVLGHGLQARLGERGQPAATGVVGAHARLSGHGRQGYDTHGVHAAAGPRSGSYAVRG